MVQKWVPPKPDIPVRRLLDYNFKVKTCAAMAGRYNPVNMVNIRHWPGAALILDRRLRLWIKSALGKRLVFAGNTLL